MFKNITWVPDIDFVIRKAWSMRIFLIIAVLSGTVTVAEFVLATGGEPLAGIFPPGIYPLAVGILSVLGMYFRAVLQQKTTEVVNGEVDDQQVSENN